MDFNLSTVFFLFFLVMILQPILTGRVFALRRAQAIRTIERKRGSRVITMIHRQERRSLFGFSMSSQIGLEDAQSIISAIKATPDETPIDIVLHTPGGLVIASMQIARAIEAHPAKVTVFVPIYAMSGGTLMALAADEIVMGEFSMLGPIDPQIMGISAASIIAARDAKPIEHVSDVALVLADVSDKATAQVKRGAVEIMTPRMERNKAEALADTLTSGQWTHDYALTPTEATDLGLPITVGLPQSVLDLMTLYPSPVKQSAVEFLPFDPPGRRMG
ncbi:serine protease, ClpP class [Roseovarius lutimaris]|uniref:Serine protease, ClpP class n=1 Tax=Roseovarius lutimaris TaxID=1005928 RepID=A0A1I5E397_9RHOB|nr:ATP-dependent Clp protease proteolytic subunit [Roseovarius lutimaris]SFO05958.1 serine protease, ClpP class [Roseovarius lutimaris]